MIKQHPVYTDYGADKDGSIWSLRYGKRLKQDRRDDGYLQLNIRHQKQRVKVKAHHMILECFIGLRPDNTEACHSNGKRDDNRLDNLRWCTRQSNREDREKNRVKDYGYVFTLLI